MMPADMSGHAPAIDKLNIDRKSKPTPKRKRSVHFNFWATEDEATLIRQRMADAGIISLGAYFRKMAIDGYCVNLDLTDVRELVRLLRINSNNLNQIARRANETRSVYEADIEDLRRQYDKLWDAANGILEGLMKIK